MDSKTLKDEIVRTLQKDARLTPEALADRLRSDADTVQRLVAQLEADGTIVGYRAVVNEERAGQDTVRAIIEVEVQPERDGGFDTVASTIAKFEEVHSVFLVSGRYDLRLEVEGGSLQEVASFVASKLAPQPGVRSTATHFLLRKYKEAGVYLHEDEEYERLKVVP